MNNIKNYINSKIILNEVRLSYLKKYIAGARKLGRDYIMGKVNVTPTMPVVVDVNQRFDNLTNEVNHFHKYKNFFYDYIQQPENSFWYERFKRLPEAQRKYVIKKVYDASVLSDIYKPKQHSLVNAFNSIPRHGTIPLNDRFGREDIRKAYDKILEVERLASTTKANKEKGQQMFQYSINQDNKPQSQIRFTID